MSADEIPPVLMVADLEREGLAHESAVAFGGGRRFDISTTGQRRLRENQAARRGFARTPRRRAGSNCRRSRTPGG